MKAATMTWMTMTWTRVFLVKGAYNIVLSVTFLLWADEILPWLGAPAGNPVCVELFLTLCLAFGVGYVLVGLEIDKNHGLVAIGILGQAGLFTVVAWQWMKGNVYAMALPSGVIDLAFAVAFARFLWCYAYAPGRYRAPEAFRDAA
jgi:hypothetical protein